MTKKSEFKELEELVKEFEADFKELDETAEELTTLYESLKDELDQLEKEAFSLGKPKRQAKLKIEMTEIESELAKIKEKRQKVEISEKRLMNITNRMTEEARAKYNKDIVQELERKMIEFESFLIGAKEASNALTNELDTSIQKLNKYCSKEAKSRMAYSFAYYKPYNAVSNELEKFKRKL